MEKEDWTLKDEITGQTRNCFNELKRKKSEMLTTLPAQQKKHFKNITVSNLCVFSSSCAKTVGGQEKQEQE